MNRFILLILLCMLCLTGCGTVTKEELSYSFKDIISKEHWISTKFPENVHIESPENWFINDGNERFYYWKESLENQSIFQEWLEYTRNHSLGTTPFMYGLYAHRRTLLFSRDIRWTCSSDGVPYVEFQMGDRWTMRRANKYDKKLKALIDSLITEDNKAKMDDAAKIKEKYYKPY